MHRSGKHFLHTIFIFPTAIIFLSEWQNMVDLLIRFKVTKTFFPFPALFQVH